jgi:hypothetical protein
MRILAQYALLFLAIFAATEARADILFIDANNSQEEVATARRAAIARGERLLVVPEHAKPGALNKGFLNQQVGAALKTGRKFESIIVSGESIGDKFLGKNGGITAEEISDVVHDNPSLLKTVHSVYGLGCYSASFSMAIRWKTMMPGLKMIVGYDGQAPKSFRQPGLDFLYGALLKEKTIIVANEDKRSTKDIEKIIRSIPDFNMNHDVVYTEHACFSSNFKSITSEDFTSRCTPQSFDIESEHAMDFFSMLHPELRQDNVPCDRQDSKLRKFYEQIRNHDHCKDVDDNTNFAFLNASANQVIRMIYFSNVLANFEAIHKSELNELASIEKEHQPGFPDLNLQESFACDKNSGLTRPEITKWIQKLGQSESELSGHEKDLVSSLQLKMETQLGSMNCVPDSWIEPVGSMVQTDASQECFEHTGAR